MNRFTKFLYAMLMIVFYAVGILLH